ncbi:WD40 repeat-containing protein [Artemisia annua]|uniref:WD40 repeat-containing protein n=1 Tax=Artemisia annua TaxID=35608 RepID=A0A2U1LTM5_ARTAN|nr:WD40 repeat-containing protein [Artemisia annua]
MEGSIVLAFENSCKAMFDQVDATFQKGLQWQVDSTHSPLTVSLRDAINSAEVANDQRKVVALAVAATNSKTGGFLMTQLSNGLIDGFCEMVEAPVDPKELSRLVYEHKYEEAFTYARQRSDVWIVSWLCSQVCFVTCFLKLICDTSRELSWMMDPVVAIKPSDGMIAMHVRPILDQVYSMLNNQHIGEIVSIGGLNPDVNKKLSVVVADILGTKLSVPKF